MCTPVSITSTFSCQAGSGTDVCPVMTQRPPPRVLAVPRPFHRGIAGSGLAELGSRADGLACIRRRRHPPRPCSRVNCPGFPDQGQVSLMQSAISRAGIVSLLQGWSKSCTVAFSTSADPRRTGTSTRPSGLEGWSDQYSRTASHAPDRRSLAGFVCGTGGYRCAKYHRVRIR